MRCVTHTGPTHPQRQDCSYATFVRRRSTTEIVNCSAPNVDLLETVPTHEQVLAIDHCGEGTHIGGGIIRKPCGYELWPDRVPYLINQKVRFYELAQHSLFH